MAADAYEAAHEKWAQLIAHLRSPEAHQMNHSDLEALLEVEGRELLRRLLQAHLDERSPGTVAEPVLGADGRAHTHQRTQTRRLMTIFGEVEVTRTGYGGHGIESLHPLDAALNVPPEHYSHGVRHRVAVEAAKTSFDDVVATIATTTGAHVPKRQAEQLVERAAQDFEAFYDTQLTLHLRRRRAPATCWSSARMARACRCAKRTCEQERARPPKRLPPPAAIGGSQASARTANGWRRWRPSIPSGHGSAPRRHRARVAADACGHFGPARAPKPSACGPRSRSRRAEVIDQAFEEAERRDPQHTKQWVALVDGNLTQLCLLYAAAAAYGVTLCIVLDLIHMSCSTCGKRRGPCIQQVHRRVRRG